MIDPTIVLLASATVEKRLAQELAKVYAAEKIVGPKGDTGNDGKDGPKGDKGDKGEKGDPEVFVPIDPIKELQSRKDFILSLGEADLKDKLMDWLVDWATGNITITQLKNRITTLRQAYKTISDAEK